MDVPLMSWSTDYQGVFSSGVLSADLSDPSRPQLPAGMSSAWVTDRNHCSGFSFFCYWHILYQRHCSYNMNMSISVLRHDVSMQDNKRTWKLNLISKDSFFFHGAFGLFLQNHTICCFFVQHWKVPLFPCSVMHLIWLTDMHCFALINLLTVCHQQIFD